MLRHAVKVTLVFLVFSTVIRAQGLDTGPWPTQDHDNRRSNQGSFSGPTSPGTPQLIYDAGSPIVSELVITSDGKLVLGGCSQQAVANQIVSIDAAGKPVWPAPYTLIASNNESPMGFTVDGSGRIYVAAHDCPDIPGAAPVHLYSILPTGTSTPNWPIGFSAMYEPAAVGADGTIYQMDELTTLRALRPSDGSTLWSQNFCCYGQGAIALDSAGNLYATADGDYYGGSGLWSWTSTGTLRWTALTDTGGATFDRLFDTTVISPADVIYTSSVSGTVYAFNTSGSLLQGWPFVTGSTTPSDSQRDPLAVGGSGTVYIKTVSAVFAINPDGTEKWSYSPGGDGTLSTVVVLDDNENVYLAFGDTIYSLTSSGAFRWSVSLTSPGRLYIGGSGTLYVISANQKVYAIKDATSPSAAVSVSPSLLNFPNQTVNTTSSVLAVTVTNIGNAPLDMANTPSITGTNAGDFAIGGGTTCTNGASIAPGNSCLIEVTFTPSTAAGESAGLSVYDDASGSPQIVSLTGMGTTPVAPAPVITSTGILGSEGVSPPQAVQGGQVMLFLINGSNFQSGATVSFKDAGITITVIDVQPTQITLNLSLATTAASGMHGLSLTNPDGQPATFANALNVLAIPPTPQGLSAVVGNQTVRLQWDENQAAPQGYIVNVYLNGTLMESSGLLSQAGWSGNNLPNGQIYRFDIAAVGGGGQSDPATIFAEPNAFVAPAHPQHPILFLHGINANATYWETVADFLTSTLGWSCGGTLAYLPTDQPSGNPPIPARDTYLLANPSYPVPSPCNHAFTSDADYFTADFGDKLADYPDGRGIYHQGDELGGFVARLQNRLPLSIVAWSMGGLAARSYIQLSPAWQPNQTSDLITLGTPHWGVDRHTLEQLGEIGTGFPVLGGAISTFISNWPQVLSSQGLQYMDGGCVANGDSTDYAQMSPFLQALDINLLLPTSLRYVAVFGTVPVFSYPDRCNLANTTATDLIVPVASATFTHGIQELMRDDNHLVLPTDISAILCALDQNCLELRVMSPVNIQVTAPSGNAISNSFTSMPGADYTTTTDPDGHETATILIPFPQGGQYTIAVTPKTGAQATDTFTILQMQDGATTTVADRMPVADIPPTGFQTTVKNGASFTVNFGGSVQQPLTNDGNGHFVAAVTITNQGNVTVDSAEITSANTKLSTSSLASVAGAINRLSPGASATVTLTFPVTSMLSTAASAPLKITGTYSAGALSGNWILTFRSVTLGSSIVGEN